MLRSWVLASAEPKYVSIWKTRHIGVRLYIQNDGTTKADGFVSELSFPQDCPVILADEPLNKLPGWNIVANTKTNTVKAIGRDLVQGDRQLLGRVLLELRPPAKTYELLWKANMGNRTTPTTGKLELNVC